MGKLPPVNTLDQTVQAMFLVFICLKIIIIIIPFDINYL